MRTATLPNAKTQVRLLTGFLGSGKTTLLQRVLSDPAMEGTAVLINEFGEIGLDHHLLDRIDENVAVLNSGCVCCTVRGEIADALLKLHTQRAKGEIPWFERVVIETTGLADPFPVMSTIQSHPVLYSQFFVAGVVATVDAVNGLHQLSERLEAIRQIGAADIVVITKTDLEAAGDVQELTEALQRLNPTARHVFGPDAGADEFLLQTASGNGIEPALPGFQAFAIGSGAQQTKSDSSILETRHGSVQSFSISFNGSIDWTAFGMWLTMLLNRHGDRVFRVKGILDIEGEDRPVAIHGVQRLVHPPVHMSAWPNDQRGSRIVFIVEGIDPKRIQNSLEVFKRLSERVLISERPNAVQPDTEPYHAQQ